MNIPNEVLKIAEALKKAKFQAYLVGGCLRDLLISREPTDWDIATDAKPEEIQKLFPESVYENTFGTVGVKTEATDPRLKVIEITTFRLEGRYTDKRHPDEVKFAKTIEEDLSRRDFTINAMALKCDANIRIHANDTNSYGLVDPFKGQADLKKKIIRAVGDPEARFSEDALRLMRAVRFAAQLSSYAGSRGARDFFAQGGPASGWTIQKETAAAILKKSSLLEFIAKERIRDELSKLLMTDNAAQGIVLMQKFGLLRHVIPELEVGIGVEQNQHHIYDVFEHNLRSLAYAAEKGYSLEVRMAALLHDVGKPRSRQWKDKPTGKKIRPRHPDASEGSTALDPSASSLRMTERRGDWTFYGHQVIGERIVAQILERLHYSKEFIEYVSLMVYEHMFVYDPEIVTLAGVRRLLSRVGAENIPDLIKVREADRIGSGVPKAQPYRLRYLQAMIEKVKSDPVSAKMLAVNGNDIMKFLEISPGPKLGQIIAVLLEDVLADPAKNTKEILLKRASELKDFDEKKLIEMASQSKQRASEAQEKIDEEIKRKYFV